MPDLLRFLTCGSVDDGKSTLIGRMLRDCGAIAQDRLEGLTDLSLLADGLEAEREQGITIDVAYLYFASAKRRYILADTPGHEQYTRNMATGASNADLALVLIDARKGLLTQTRRHSRIARLLGIRHFILAVNKMDLVGYDQEAFERIRGEYEDFGAAIGVDRLTAIPVSALEGDNVVAPSAHMPWYEGPTLLDCLDAAEPEIRTSLPFRMPVQNVIRDGGRLYAGAIASGEVRPGDRIAILPAGTPAEVARICAMEGDQDRAEAGQSIAIQLKHD